MDMMSLRRRVMVNQNKLMTATGNPITFNTPLTKPLKECVVRFTPQQEGSGTPSPDNVRNISGRSSVKLWQSGKNLAANGIYCGRIRPNDTTYVGSVYYCHYFPIPKAPIYISKTGTTVPLISVSMEIPASGVSVIDSGIPTMTNVKHYIFDNTEIGAKYMCLHGANNSKFQDLTTLLDDAELMVTTGDYDDDYVTSPSRLNEITFTFPSTVGDSGVVYGGYLDMEKGEVVAEYAEKVITGDENWLLSAWTGNNGVYLTHRETSYDTAVIPFMAGQSYSNMLMDGGVGYYNRPDGSFGIVGLGTVPNYTYLFLNNTAWGTTVEEYKAKLKELYEAGTPLTIVAPLKTAYIQHYSLTPQSIATLRGANVMWSDANGDISVKYWTR